MTPPSATPLDVLLYTHSFAGGGAERVIVQLANHWAGRGFRTALVVNLDEGPLRAEVAEGVEIIQLGIRRGLLAAPALARLLRGRRPRAMAAGITMQNLVACLSNRLAGRPARLIVTEHNFLSVRPDNLHSALHRVVQEAVRWIYPLADVVSAVSAAAARDLDRRLGRPEGTATVVYNPIWPPARIPGLAPCDVHPFFGGPDPVVVSVGRLMPQKNHHNLIDAIAVARRTRPVRAVVIGEGQLRAELEVHVDRLGLRDAIDFPGFRRNVGDFLAAADLFVLSSDTEGLPLAMMEAMQMGTPVVSTDCPTGPDELLADGAYGALVPMRDPEALGAAILAALEAPADPERLKARASAFTIDSIARRYEQAIFPQSGG